VPIETKHLQDVLNNHGQDMSNKVVAVTGTTSGTGFVCARELGKLGATVILLNRQSERAQSALQELQTAAPNATFDAVTCDLQNLDSVTEAIETIKAKYDVLDVLINNAGVMALKDQATVDGFDVQMQTNVLSHFLLTKELFPLLKKSPMGAL
jgi:NAD(P)-dependent dehydrogenase (short-subunit alcohol dehydrogenase family)